jgi:magnesium transporter
MSLDLILDDPVLAHAQPAGYILRASDTLGAVLEQLRGMPADHGVIYFFAVNEDDRLVGVVPTRRMLMNDPGKTIEEIMLVGVVYVPASATVGQAAEIMRRYRFLSLPIVDDERRIVGSIDLSTFGQVVNIDAPAESESDAFQLFGMRLDMAGSPSPLRGFRGRFPWLLANIAGGIAGALVVNEYEPIIELALVVALFIPVVLSLSESVSIQSMTITLQSIHHREPDGRSFRRAFFRELATSILLGLACGLLVGGIAWVWKRDIAVALALVSALTLSMLSACMAGLALPVLVHKLRGDPSIAAGPIVLAATDIMALLFYLNLAGMYLEKAGS